MEKPKLETWQSGVKGIVAVKKFDRRGELKDEVIRAGQKFTITTEERIFNQDRAANPDLDDFRNGRLIPVRLLDGTEDAKEIASNPNLIGEGEMADLLKGHFKTLESKLKSISNTVALQRFLAVAEQNDATIKQVAAIRERIEEVNPVTVVERESRPVGRIEPGRAVST